jgi:hypothetical protein
VPLRRGQGLAARLQFGRHDHLSRSALQRCHFSDVCAVGDGASIGAVDPAGREGNGVSGLLW